VGRRTTNRMTWWVLLALLSMLGLSSLRSTTVSALDCRHNMTVVLGNVSVSIEFWECKTNVSCDDFRYEEASQRLAGFGCSFLGERCSDAGTRTLNLSRNHSLLSMCSPLNI